MPRYALFALTLMGCALNAHAQSIEPGLWEMSSPNMAISGQSLPDMQILLAQVPAEQRAMMQQMLQQNGINLGQNGGIQVCITPQQIAKSEIPLNDPASGCQQQVTERSAKRWKFNFSCPQGTGQGEVQFISSKEFSTEVQGQFSHQGMTQNGTMKTRARWVKADCGGLKSAN